MISRRHTVLLALEQVERDGVGVVGVQQLLALACRACAAAGLAAAFALGVAA